MNDHLHGTWLIQHTVQCDEVIIQRIDCVDDGAGVNLAKFDVVDAVAEVVSLERAADQFQTFADHEARIHVDSLWLEIEEGIYHQPSSRGQEFHVALKKRTVIADCIRIKADIVCRDERDLGQRQLLNLGHTFGHALEKLNSFSIYHGEGVAVGLLIAAFAAEKHGLCQTGVYAELRRLLSDWRLPVSTSFDARTVAQNALNDKKRQGDRITLVLPVRRGRSELYPLPTGELASFIACCDGEVTGL